MTEAISKSFQHLRHAIVGWVRSFFRSAERREILFDLDQVVAALKTSNADRNIMNPVMKVRNTLTLLWADD